MIPDLFGWKSCGRWWRKNSRNPRAGRRGRLPIGCKAFDQKGGFLRGAVTEVCGSIAGGGLLLAAVVDAAVRDGLFVGLIDAANSFEPSDWVDEQLRRILWVMCGSAGPAIRAADILLRDGNLPVVVLDLQMLPMRTVAAHPGEHVASFSTHHRTDRHCADDPDAAADGGRRRHPHGDPHRTYLGCNAFPPPCCCGSISMCRSSSAARLRSWRSFKNPHEAPCLAAFFCPDSVSRQPCAGTMCAVRLSLWTKPR